MKYLSTNKCNLNKPISKGSITLLVIVFSGIFFTLLIALSSFVLSQNRMQSITQARSEAFNIAEAGLEHYRWYLSHFPGDTTNGTGKPGPYIVSYANPQGGTAGDYSLSVVGNKACGVVQSIDVTSTGTSSSTPGVSSSVWARYAKPSVARYSMIVGASTWFDGTKFNGPLHSNGGLRMDNTSNNAPVSSSLLSWNCTYSFGCKTSKTVTGVFGNGSNKNLWKYPTPQMDFLGISAQFPQEKTLAQTSGLYFPRVSTSANSHLGYHLIFNSDNTVTVSKVTAVDENLGSYPLVDGLSNGKQVQDSGWWVWTSSGWKWRVPGYGLWTLTNYGWYGPGYSLIKQETLKGIYTVPTSCSIIFVEDNAWIEGSISKKVTVIAANSQIGSSIRPNIVLTNNIKYTTFDGSAGLTAIASRNVLIGPNTPQDLTLDGIFVATNGAFGRNEYCGNPYQYRGKLSMFGSIVSMLRQNNYWITPSWCNDGQGTWSGYPDNQWTFVFDRQNSTNPPAFTPVTSSQWQFVDWKQQ